MTVDANKSFYKDIEKLDAKDEIFEALKELRKSQSLSETKLLKKIKGSKNRFRLKVGDYRVLIEWDKQQQVLTAIAAAHRKDIYKKR
jgi:mRNA interferase RelE/StbE